MKSIQMILVVAFIAMYGCKTRQGKVQLIRDCPEEKIINRMPTIREEGVKTEPGSYFIYKGERRELKEFDLEWIGKNCEVKETVVH